MSSDAPEVPPTTNEPSARAALARRIEFILIAIGGVFIILGWGIGHQEWARALGWICTGIGFAIEMVYGRVLRPSGKDGPKGKPPLESRTDAGTGDESAPGPGSAPA